MEPSRVFLKVRAIAFSSIAFTSQLWVILLCVFAYIRWDTLQSDERTLLSLLLAANTITLLVLLILILVPFRLWLDTARFLLLVALQIGSAIAFTASSTGFRCARQSAQLCHTLNICIIVGSWIIPGLLLAYCSWVLFALYRHWRYPSETSNFQLERSADEEASVAVNEKQMTQGGRPVLFVDIQSARGDSEKTFSTDSKGSFKTPDATRFTASFPPPNSDRLTNSFQPANTARFTTTFQTPNSAHFATTFQTPNGARLTASFQTPESARLSRDSAPYVFWAT